MNENEITKDNTDRRRDGDPNAYLIKIYTLDIKTKLAAVKLKAGLYSDICFV